MGRKSSAFNVWAVREGGRGWGQRLNGPQWVVLPIAPATAPPSRHAFISASPIQSNPIQSNIRRLRHPYDVGLQWA